MPNRDDVLERIDQLTQRINKMQDEGRDILSQSTDCDSMTGYNNVHYIEHTPEYEEALKELQALYELEALY